MLRTMTGLAAIAIAATIFNPSNADAQNRVKAGVLRCNVSGSVGMIVTSQQKLNCIFNPSRPGPDDQYFGTIRKFGLDLGITAGGEMVWAVFAPSAPVPGALSGAYVGATAAASIAVGLGANALVGGSNSTIALQPLSVQGQVGLNIAVGVAELQLEYAPPPPPPSVPPRRR
jgi:Protein of unknown function (DUF992)